VPSEPVPLTFLVNFVRPFAVRVTSTSGGAHVVGSYHYVHRAIDVVGTAAEMEKLARAAVGRPHAFREVFYDPLGRYVKNGQVRLGHIGGHRDHVHLAR
jgi:hypothetical protein